MEITKEVMIANITWKSEDGYQFMATAKGQNWDVVQTTNDKIRSLEVGNFVWCEKKHNEDWGIYLEEITEEPFATETEYNYQESLY